MNGLNNFEEPLQDNKQEPNSNIIQDSYQNNTQEPKLNIQEPYQNNAQEPNNNNFQGSYPGQNQINIPGPNQNNLNPNIVNEDLNNKIIVPKFIFSSIMIILIIAEIVVELKALPKLEEPDPLDDSANNGGFGYFMIFLGLNIFS